MKKQITRISPHQSSKVVAIIYTTIFIPIGLLGLIAALFAGPSKSWTSFIFLIISPILYGILGYLFHGLFCLLYNLVVRWVGGVEFETTDMPDA